MTLEQAVQELTSKLPNSKIIEHKQESNGDLLIKISDRKEREWWFRCTDSGIFLEGQDR